MSGDHNQYQKPDKAFPHHLREDYKGMDLRDYFAAKALPLAMQWIKHNTDREVGLQWTWTDDDFEHNSREIAELAYKFADAMMVARESHE